MAESSTLGELHKAKANTEVEVRAAVDACRVDLTTSLFLLGAGDGLDFSGAIRVHEPATKAITAS
ncbi:hypothetical protein [Methylobacterium sp. A54F]